MLGAREPRLEKESETFVDRAPVTHRRSPANPCAASFFETNEGRRTENLGKVLTASPRNFVAMNEVLEDDLEEVYQFAIDLAKSSGKILLEGLERRRVTEGDCAPEVIEKLNAVDIVTQTDTGACAF